MIALLGFLLIGAALARPDVSHLKDHGYGHYTVHNEHYPSHGSGSLQINEQRYELPSVGHHHGVLSHVDGQHHGVLSHVDGQHHGVLSHVDGQHHGVLSHVGGQHHGVLSHVDGHHGGQHQGVLSYVDGQHVGGQHVGGQQVLTYADGHHQGVLSHVGGHIEGQHQGILSHADAHHHGVLSQGGEHHHGVLSHVVGGALHGGHHDGLRVVENQHVQRLGDREEGIHVLSNEHLQNDGQRVLVKSVHTEQHQEVPQQYELPATSYGVPITDRYGQVSVHSNFPSNLQSTYYTPSTTNVYNKDYYDTGKVDEERHVYYFSAPDAAEERPRLRIHLTPFHKKNTNIVFVKVPEYANPIPEVIAPPSDFEDKTKVYVLLKGNKENEPVVYTAPAPTKSLQPEVFVYKYNNEHDLSTVLSGGREGQSVGTGVYHHDNEQSFVNSLAESRAAFVHNDKYSGLAPRFNDVVGHTVVTQNSIPVVNEQVRTVVTKEETIPAHYGHHDAVSSVKTYTTQNTAPVVHQHVVPSSGISTYKTYTTQNSVPVVNEQVRTVVTKEETIPANYGSSVKTYSTQNTVPVVHQHVVPSSGISTYKTYTTQNTAPVVNEQVRTVVTNEETIPAHYGHHDALSSVKTYSSQSGVPSSGISTYKTYSTENSAPVVGEQLTRTVVTKETVPAVSGIKTYTSSSPIVGQEGISSQYGRTGVASFKTITSENVAPSLTQQVTRTTVTKEETVPSGVVFHGVNSKRETPETKVVKDEKKTEA